MRERSMRGRIVRQQGEAPLIRVRGEGEGGLVRILKGVTGRSASPFAERPSESSPSGLVFTLPANVLEVIGKKYPGLEAMTAAARGRISRGGVVRNCAGGGQGDPSSGPFT